MIANGLRRSIPARLLTIPFAVLIVGGAMAGTSSVDRAADERAGTAAAVHPASAADRRIALTFDDLPVVSRTRRDLAFQERVTAALLETLVRRSVPAIGFVNEDKLEVDGVVDPRRVALLRRWLEAGLELGNHSYSHPDLHRISLDAYRADVVRGERITRALVDSAGGALRWFRHPFLHTGRSLETRRAFEDFLASHGYNVAPVTVDNYDYLFAAAFDVASARDSAVVSLVADEYIAYMGRVVEFYEAQSLSLLGREIPHVLLLHANALNAATLDRLLDMLEQRGYAFVPLADVVADTVYRSADTYVGPAGITWLHRWALTAGKRGAAFAGEPEVPAWINELAGQ